MDSWRVSDEFGTVELDCKTGVLRVDGRNIELNVALLRELRNTADWAIFNLNRKGMTS